MTSVSDVTSDIFWHDLNYIVYVVVWPKFGNSSISIREVIITLILKTFNQKIFFWEVILI